MKKQILLMKKTLLRFLFNFSSILILKNISWEKVVSEQNSEIGVLVININTDEKNIHQ